MKSWIPAVALALLPMVAHADFRSVREAEDTVRSYENLAEAARRAADESYPRGGRHFDRGSFELRAMQALDDVSDLSNELSRELYRVVLRPLKANVSEFRVERRLDRVKENQIRLNQAVRALGISLSRDLERLAWDAARNWQQLERSLNEWDHHGPGPGPGPGPIGQLAATCVGKVGGNFFRPEAHVECTVIGRGAKAYEVTFNGQSGQASAQGELNGKDSFVTQKVKVGWAYNYSVTLVTFRGERVQVVTNASAQGRPF